MKVRYRTSADTQISAHTSTSLKGWHRALWWIRAPGCPLAYTSRKIPHQQAVRLSIQFWCCYFLTGALIKTKPSYVFVSLNYKNEEYLNSLLFPLQGKKHLAKQHTGYLCFLRAMPVFPSFRHETREKNPCSLLVLDHLCTVMNSPDCLQELWG